MMKKKKINCPRCFSSKIEYLKNGTLVCNRCGFDDEVYSDIDDIQNNESDIEDDFIYFGDEEEIFNALHIKNLEIKDSEDE